MANARTAPAAKIETADEAPAVPEIKVKTTGAFMLVDPQTGLEFVEDVARPTRRTTFVEEQLGYKKLIEA